MAEVDIVSPETVQKLLAEGSRYVDVRSQEEFEQGHVPGSFNIPISHQGPEGFVPNLDFVAAMLGAFGKTEKLVLGCASGTRSRRAAQLLTQAGYQQLCEMRTGLDGSRDAFGRLTRGWKAKGLPIESGSPEGRRYEDLRVGWPHPPGDPAEAGKRTRA